MSCLFNLAKSQVLIIADIDIVMQTRKQSGVHRILKVCKERAWGVRSEYAFAKFCHK